MRNLKHFYLLYVCKHIFEEFLTLVSYARFVELQQRVAFIDSTALKVYYIKREHKNKVFQNIATKGKGSLGWFFGLKLHIIINDKGEILCFVITQGNVDDRQALSGKFYPQYLLQTLC